MKIHKLGALRFPSARTSAVLTCSLLLLVLLSARHTNAAATKIDFEAAELLAPVGPPGKIWVSGGIQHIRDFVVTGQVWGDLEGTLTVAANINWDLTTGNGTAFGTFLLAVEWNGLVGTFEGRSEWKYEGFRVLIGQATGQGTGDFEGMQLQANFFDTETGTPLIGTILIPNED